MITATPAAAAHPPKGDPVGLLRMPFHPRTWRETLYLLLSFPIGIAGFVFAVTVLSVGAALLVTLVGLPIIALAILGGRAFGALERARAAALLGERIRPPHRWQPAGPGLWNWIKTGLGDGPGWRALAYLFLLFPWSVLTFTMVVTAWSIALGGLTYPLWYRWSNDGLGAQLGTWDGRDQFLDSGWELAAAAGVGLVFLFLTPYLVRGFTTVERVMARTLLGATSMTERIRDLETSRGSALDANAADLRRIERDLHDGTQARLVALSMDLGRAKDKLADDPDQAATLVARAHDEVKVVLAELRGIARGIHPAVLTDRGLDAALSAVAARTPVPVSVRVSLPDRPDPATEAMAYFCACELLANVSAHSRASTATLDLSRTGELVRLVVGDNGVGGADPARGTGLAGLADRVRTVDGTISVVSPAGGPTVVTVELPWTP